MGNKVLFVSTQMEAGGVQIRSTSMQQALLEEGIDIDVVFLYRKRSVFKESERLYCLLDSPPKGALSYLRIFHGLWTIMRTKRPVAVVGFAHYSSPIACIFAALIGCERRVATQTNPPSTLPKLAWVLDYLCGILGIYTQNIAASNSVREDFAHYPTRYKKNLTVVYNGVGPQSSHLSKSESRKQFGLPENTLLVITCGRLSNQKNFTFLLRVLAELESCHLAILGDGELRDDLERQAEILGIRQRVTFLGEVEPARVKDFLRSGDVFAFPSHFEAFGLAVAEAMMSGLPVVSSDHPGLKEVVADAGVLLPVDDTAPWVETIKAILADEARRQEMSARSVAQASKFTFETMLHGFRDAILG